MLFTAVVAHEPPSYVVCCLEVEVTSQGDSLEAALNKPVLGALEPYFEDQPFPDHTDTPIIAPVDVPP
jgi:hypothetical protein